MRKFRNEVRSGSAPIQDPSMPRVLLNVRTAAVISFVIALPFAILDLAFNGRNVTDLAVLFGLLWLLALAFIAITMPIVQNIRAGNSVVAKPITLLLSVTAPAFIAVMWISIIVDQFPCFLGIPNCD